jgi:hypothetical protein
MAIDSNLEHRNERDALAGTELDSVTAGADSSYNRMLELMSKVLQSAADTRKAIIANIR